MTTRYQFSDPKARENFEYVEMFNEYEYVNTVELGNAFLTDIDDNGQKNIQFHSLMYGCDELYIGAHFHIDDVPELIVQLGKYLKDEPNIPPQKTYFNVTQNEVFFVNTNEPEDVMDDYVDYSVRIITDINETNTVAIEKIERWEGSPNILSKYVQSLIVALEYVHTHQDELKKHEWYVDVRWIMNVPTNVGMF